MEYKNIEVKGIFEVSKTPDKFFDVKFHFTDGHIWDGALPICLRYQGFEINETHESYQTFAEANYHHFSFTSSNEWDALYLFPAIEQELYGPDTTKVLAALKSGKWECRVCGPVPQANAQPAARLRDLKQRGFCIATKRINCTKCGKSTYHDLLVKLPPFDKSIVVQRHPISNVLKRKIYNVFNFREACFSRKESAKNLIIDHKFPSDRWNIGESENKDDMSELGIKRKFQLLTNQTNMIKSRACTKCVDTGKRGTFMGINWFSHGNENWEGLNKYDENGCIGCPWYDIEDWKNKLQAELNKK
jgi:hypothetical protein